MLISIIAAMARNRIIGINNTLPWHLPADLQHFKQVTMGKPVIMGRKTYESIGRPLPGRSNIIISQNRDFTAEGCQVVHSIDEAFVELAHHDEVMVIGGASFYAQVLPYANRLYLTIIDEDFDGDAEFPTYNADEWQEVEHIEGVLDAKNPHPHYFITLERKIIGQT
jgi:dihydrofolate reductase